MKLDFLSGLLWISVSVTLAWAAACHNKDAQQIAVMYMADQGYRCIKATTHCIQANDCNN